MISLTPSGQRRARMRGEAIRIARALLKRTWRLAAQWRIWRCNRHNIAGELGGTPVARYWAANRRHERESMSMRPRPRQEGALDDIEAKFLWRRYAERYDDVARCELMRWRCRREHEAASLINGNVSRGKCHD